MSYSGGTYQIPCERGGLTANPNIDAVKPEMMVIARNINLNENGRGLRGGTAHVNATAITGTPRIMGIYDFWLLNGTQKLVTATTDGKVYSDYTTEIKTGLTTAKHTSFEIFDNTLYITNGANIPQTWNGVAASTSNLTNVPTDWTGSAYPKQFIKHGRGNSERLWAYLNNTVYASANGTDDFSDANVTTINIETSDGQGIVGAVEFQDRLLTFGKRKAYIIDDADYSTANWGYEAAAWEGGAAHHRLIVKTPNDIICMTEDGDIYSVTAVQQYGDYKQASLVRPSFMDKWIRDNVRLSYVADFHATYDPELRAIKFFVVRNGKTTVDTALVFFIDRPLEEAWTIHDNQTNASGYSASCSCIYRKDPPEHHRIYIYTGDYSGFVWDLEETNTNDNSLAYYGGFKTSHLSFDDPRVSKKYMRGWLTTRPQGAYDVYISWWVDGVKQTTKTVSLAGSGVALDTFLLDTDSLGGSDVIDTAFSLGTIGKRIQFEVYNGNVNETFFVSRLSVDFKPLSNRPS